MSNCKDGPGTPVDLKDSGGYVSRAGCYPPKELYFGTVICFSVYVRKKIPRSESKVVDEFPHRL